MQYPPHSVHKLKHPLHHSYAVNESYADAVYFAYENIHTNLLYHHVDLLMGRLVSLIHCRIVLGDGNMMGHYRHHLQLCTVFVVMWYYYYHHRRMVMICYNILRRWTQIDSELAAA